MASAERRPPTSRLPSRLGYRPDPRKFARQALCILSLAESILISPQRMTFFHSIGLTCRMRSESNGKSDAAAIPEISLACQ